MLTRRGLGRVASVTAVTAAMVFAPLAAYADPVASGGISDTLNIGTPGLDGLTTNAGACQLASYELYASPLSATVENKAGGEVDFVWHATAHATVSSADRCVTGIMVTSQLTDTTTMPDCPPVLQSPVGATTSNDPFTWSQSGQTDYEADNPLPFDVAYFGGPAMSDPAVGAVRDQIDTSGTSASQIGSSALKCARLRSTVGETDVAYYRNGLNQYVPFCTERLSTEFVSTPAGPQQVGDTLVLSKTC